MATFLGLPCQVNRELAAALAAAELKLRADFEATPSDQRSNVFGHSVTSFDSWHGVRAVGGVRPDAGFHSTGSAVDVNADSNPYIATRTGPTLGGEKAGALLQEERRRAVEVYDRAVEWLLTQRDKADVSGRRTGEATASVHQRFFVASRALRFYLGLAFRLEHPFVDRVPKPIVPVPPLPIDDLLATMLRQIPRTERKDEHEALQLITDVIDDGVSLGNHDRQLPKEMYFQILQDYEHVRIPMVVGVASALPARTRNPARGFMDLRQEVVVALCDVGHLRWGACDFGAGENGDMMHFDLGHDGM